MLPSDAPHPPRRRLNLPAAVYRVVLATAVLAFGVLLVWRPVLGRYDVWAHAAVGRWMCEHGRAPDRSLFLWTADEPWVYHSWLSQVIFYGLARAGGPEARAAVFLAFVAVVGLAPFALAWGVWWTRARPTCWTALPFVVALDGTAGRLEARPELFTAAFLTALLVFFALRPGTRPAGDRPGPRRWVVPAVVLALFALWANFHGAVVIGVQVLAVTAVCDFLQNRRDVRWKLPAALALLAPAAVCLNPYGPAYWLALVPVGSDRFAEIIEWFPVWRGPPVPEPVLLAAVGVPALALAAWALNPERRWAQLGWLVMFAAMFALARRNVWPLTLAGLVVLAVNARSLDPEALWARAARLVRRRSGGVPPPPVVLRWTLRVVVLIFVVLHAWPAYMMLRPWRNYAPNRLDGGIVRFVADHRLEGRVFNDYENSSYLQWRFAGCPALYIDLLNAYPDGVMADYRAIATLTDRGRELLDEQGIEVVILTTNRRGAVSLARLANHLDAHPGWARVYAGADGCVWVRRTPAFERVWRPRAGAVRTVEFATLERWGDEAMTFAPATNPDPWK
jgi:hypothetical protein